jgi:hypothetical protein
MYKIRTSVARQHSANRLAAKNMHMQMRYFLMPVLANV